MAYGKSEKARELRQRRASRLARMRREYQESFGSYWEQSASGSVMADYAAGNVVEIRVGC
jgi:hypothetical protein